MGGDVVNTDNAQCHNGVLIIGQEVIRILRAVLDQDGHAHRPARSIVHPVDRSRGSKTSGRSARNYSIDAGTESVGRKVS